MGKGWFTSKWKCQVNGNVLGIEIIKGLNFRMRYPSTRRKSRSGDFRWSWHAQPGCGNAAAATAIATKAITATANATLLLVLRSITRITVEIIPVCNFPSLILFSFTWTMKTRYCPRAGVSVRRNSVNARAMNEVHWITLLEGNRRGSLPRYIIITQRPMKEKC